jgi:hypothetical protein
MFDRTDTTTWNRTDIAVPAPLVVLAGVLVVAIPTVAPPSPTRPSETDV